MNKARKRMIILVIVVIGLTACIFIAILRQEFIRNGHEIEDSSTLPGATEINPAVRYNGEVFYWKCMYGSGKNEVLSEDYQYQGDIIPIGKDALTKDFQLSSGFDATGQLYYSERDPFHVYILITTDWIDKSYVVFSMKNEHVEE